MVDLPRPVLRSQHVSLAADFFDSQHTREPLRQLTDNARAHGLNALALPSQCIPTSIPTLPSSSTHAQVQGRPMAGAVNPIWLTPQFQAYRKKQSDQDDKSGQIWPEVIEVPFVDAFLCVPQMGRRKYIVRGEKYGRNQLIHKYLWIAYCKSLPPGAKPDAKLARTRKQVSSHIQVLKNFLGHLRCFHFFFPEESDSKDSFKDDPVLRALSEDRLPDVRPNYEYFAQLLASDSLVTLRPSLCWILVSTTSADVELEGPYRGQCYTSDGELLDAQKYPHLLKNLSREEWPDRGKIIRGTLLHEYTRMPDQKRLAQRGASSIGKIAQEWQEKFPELYPSLDQIVQDKLHDIFHFHVTLEVQEPDRLPDGSEFNSLVEVTIEQAALQNHNWKSVTRLTRPRELTSGKTTDPAVVLIDREIGNQLADCFSCENNAAGCDYFPYTPHRRHQLAIPFPASEWATMLSHLARYRKHPRDDRPAARGGARSRARARARAAPDDEPTQIDMTKRIAMLQELWSCPPDGNQSWTRRAAILWTFDTVYSVKQTAGGATDLTMVPATTTWRFLTVEDPASEEHKQKAMVSTANEGEQMTPRETAVSPHPATTTTSCYHQPHLSSATTPVPAWDAGLPPPPPAPAPTPSLSLETHSAAPLPPPPPPPGPLYNPVPISVISRFPAGLATPPPTAPLQSSYPDPLEAVNQMRHHSLGCQYAMSAARVKSPLAVVCSAGDHLLSSATSALGIYDHGSSLAAYCQPDGLAGWDVHGLSPFDPRLVGGWPANFAAGAAAGWTVCTAPDMSLAAPQWTMVSTAASTADGWDTGCSTPTSDDAGDGTMWANLDGLPPSPSSAWAHDIKGSPDGEGDGDGDAEDGEYDEDDSWGSTTALAHNETQYTVVSGGPSSSGSHAVKSGPDLGQGQGQAKTRRKRARAGSLEECTNYPSGVRRLVNNGYFTRWL